jgi:hypothetical protein
LRERLAKQAAPRPRGSQCAFVGGSLREGQVVRSGTIKRSNIDQTPARQFWIGLCTGQSEDFADREPVTAFEESRLAHADASERDAAGEIRMTCRR